MRILHLSDLHLGRKSPGDPQGAQRLISLSRLVETLPEFSLDAIVIAGDTFDGPKVQKAVIQKACNILQMCEKKDGESLPVVIIPGNHDPAEADGLWSTFQSYTDNMSILKVVLAPSVVSLLNGTLLIEAYPCETRYSPEPPWTGAHLHSDSHSDDSLRVVLAHGTLLGGPIPEGESDAYPFNLEDVESLSADYVALGHFHGVYPEWIGEGAIERTICYCGTHEPDQFQSDSGWAIIANLEQGKPTRLERIPVGYRKWRLINLENPSDFQKIRKLEREIEDESDPTRYVVRINIGQNARLTQDDFDTLEDIESTMQVLGVQIETRGKDQINVNTESLEISSLPSGAIKETLIALQDEYLSQENLEKKEIISTALLIGWEKARSQG